MTVRRALLMLFLVVGCATSPLTRYLDDHSYVAFVPPRDGGGVGTIIRYEHGTEVTVASPDPPLNQCLSPTAVPRMSRRRVALTRQSYKLTRNFQTELSLIKALSRSIDVTGAYKDDRVHAVEIELLEPFEDVMTELSVKQYIESLPADDPCRAALTAEGNFVLHTVVGAGGVRYRFVDDHGRSVKLDGALSDKIGLTGELSTKYVGNTTLEVSFPVYVGYRAWRAEQLRSDKRVVLREMSPDSLLQHRVASTSP